MHTQYTVYLPLENGTSCQIDAYAQQTVTAYYRSVLQQLREMISETLVSVCLIEGDRLIQV